MEKMLRHCKETKDHPAHLEPTLSDTDRAVTAPDPKARLDLLALLRVQRDRREHPAHADPTASPAVPAHLVHRDRKDSTATVANLARKALPVETRKSERREHQAPRVKLESPAPQALTEITDITESTAASDQPDQQARPEHPATRVHADLVGLRVLKGSLERTLSIAVAREGTSSRASAAGMLYDVFPVSFSLVLGVIPRRSI